MARQKGSTLTDEQKHVRKMVQAINFLAETEFKSKHLEAVLGDRDVYKVDVAKEFKKLAQEMEQVTFRAVKVGGKTDDDKLFARKLLRENAAMLSIPVKDIQDASHLRSNLCHLAQTIARYCWSLGPRAGKEANDAAANEFFESLWEEMKPKGKAKKVPVKRKR